MVYVTMDVLKVSPELEYRRKGAVNMVYAGQVGGLVEFDWSVLEKITGVGALLIALYLFYRLVLVFLEQWKQSNDTINRNTEGFQSLSTVLKETNEHNKEFQERVMKELKEHYEINRDTNKKVSEIHRNL